MPANKVQSCAVISPIQDTGFSGFGLYTGDAIKKAVFELIPVPRDGGASLKDGLLAFAWRERLNSTFPTRLFSLDPTRERRVRF